MDIDWKLVIQGIMLLLTVSAIYWRLHYHQKGTGDKIIEHDCLLKTQADKIVAHDRRLQDIKSEMKLWTQEIELKIEKKLTERDNKLARRLQRIEKILIKMDERNKTHAAGELVEEDV